MSKVVVIVEDAEVVASSLALAVETLPGVEAIITRDPRTALSLFGAPDSAIAALVTDLNLPYLDGFELIRQVRTLAAYRNLPIIMISADERARSLNGSTTNGANALFQKPFSTKEVCRVLEKLLQ
jgi:two-component system, chemotaxis family, chemotaxis protein CheY